MKRYNEKVRTIDYHIQQSSTGTPEQLAKKLNLSRSCLYNYIGMMKKSGAPIKFSRISNSFVYVKAFEVEDILD